MVSPADRWGKVRQDPHLGWAAKLGEGGPERSRPSLKNPPPPHGEGDVVYSFLEQDHDGLRMMMMMIGSPIIADHGNPENGYCPKLLQL